MPNNPIEPKDAVSPVDGIGGSVLSLNSAKLRANREWRAGTAGVVGYRLGFAVLRHKDVVKRYEVGYRTLVAPSLWVERFLGNGASWDQAFAEARAVLERFG